MHLAFSVFLLANFAFIEVCCDFKKEEILYEDEGKKTLFENTLIHHENPVPRLRIKVSPVASGENDRERHVLELREHPKRKDEITDTRELMDKIMKIWAEYRANRGSRRSKEPSFKHRIFRVVGPHHFPKGRHFCGTRNHIERNRPDDIDP